MEEEDKQYLLQAVFDVMSSLDHFSQSRHLSVDYQELMLKLDFFQHLLVNMNVDDSICANVGEACNILFDMEHQSQVRNETGVMLLDKFPKGIVADPHMILKEEQLSFLLEKGFKVSEISKIFGVSQRTIERRMAYFGFSVSGTVCDCRSNIYM